ncbi:MAG: Spy/CpxP family protein refolding chaperone [Burkholderiales bacterium]|nr:Spy/CpxP family protein refolding chaperone [Burkholderiales bacterium]
MKLATKFVVTLGTALTLGLGAAAVNAQPFGYGMGPGMMGGNGGPGYAAGPGYRMGYGMGPGMMNGNGAGYGMGPGMMGGNGGPGYAAGPGYSMGYGMGPGMMYGNGTGYGMGHGMMGGYGVGYGMGPQAMLGGCAGNADEGLAALKSELGITAKQDAAWQTFVDNAKKQGENRQAWFEKMQEARGAGSAPEMLAQQTEWMKQRQTEMAANAAALKSLYATLTPEQKTIADQRFGGFSPGWMQGYRGGPRGYRR